MSLGVATEWTISAPSASTGPGEIPTFRHFIAGEWCEGTAGATFESRNPADTRDVVGRFQQGTVGSALAELTDRLVQHACNGADFVVTMIAGWTAEVAGGVALGRVREAAHAPGEHQRCHPRQPGRGQQANQQ